MPGALFKLFGPTWEAVKQGERCGLKHYFMRRRTVRKGSRSNSIDRFGAALMRSEFAGDWQKSLAKLMPLAVGMLAATQTQAGEILELMGRSTQAKVRLMHQAMHATQDPTLFGRQAKWIGFWFSALGLAQTNTASMIQINSRVLNSWLRLAGQSNVCG